MKRVLTVLTILLMTFALCACSSDKSTVDEFVGPIAEKYGIDLTCSGITKVYSRSDDSPYMYTFTSDKFSELANEEKIDVLADLDNTYIQSADGYMDLEATSVKKLAEQLENTGHGCMNVKASWVIIQSKDKEYSVYNYWNFHEEYEKGEGENACELLNPEMLEDDNYYLVEFDKEAGTCVCIGLYEVVVIETDFSSIINKMNDNLKRWDDAEKRVNGIGSSGSSSSGTGEKCLVCNGTGYVRYYYGGSSLEAALDGEPDYTVGPCTSCGGTGRQ